SGRAVQPAGRGAKEVVDPGVVLRLREAGQVGPHPLPHQVLQPGGGQVVSRAVADEDVVAALADHIVGPGTADDDVAAAAAGEDVIQVVANQDVIAGAAGDVLDVAHAPGGAGGGAQRQVDADVGGVSEVVQRVDVALAVDRHRAGQARRVGAHQSHEV